MIDHGWWVRGGLTMLGLAGLIACKPPKGLGEGPPKVDEQTALLATFVPAALAERGASGLDLTSIAHDGVPEPPPKPQLPPPAMLEHSPIGETGDYANIEFRFNRPVVPLGERERLDPAQLGLTITPSIAGELYFAEPTRLVFAPNDALPPAQIYEVRLDARLQAVDGPAFDAKASFSFSTPGPRVSMWPNSADAMQSGDVYHWKSGVRLDSGGDVRLEQLAKHLHVEAIDEQGRTRPQEFSLRKAKRSRWGYDDGEFELAPKTRWPAGSEIVVRVDANLKGRRGPKPIGYEETLSFRVAAGVEVSSVSCYQQTYTDGCEIGPILVNFSAPVQRRSAKLVDVSPDSRGFDTLAFDRLHDYDANQPRDAYWSILAWGDYSLGGRYEVTIDPSLRDIHGQPLTGEHEFQIDFVEPPPSLVLASARGTLVLAKSPRVGIETRHVETLRVRAAVLDDAALERALELPIGEVAWPKGGHDAALAPSFQGNYGWASTELDLGKFTGNRPGAVLFEVGVESLLPRARNRPLPELPAQRGLVQISDLGVSIVGSLPGGAVRVADVTSDKPIAGAEIELVLAPGGERKRLGKTDAEGLLALPSSSELPSSAMLRARKGDDALLVDVGGLASGGSAVAGLRVGESVRAAITSERKLYKPGESVRVIGWASIASPYELSGLRRLPSKTEVEVVLRDVHGEVVATRKVRAKPHGKFWATLPIPAHGSLGDYTVGATLLGSTQQVGIEVKDFVAPEFEVTAEAAKPDIHHGETTKVDVNARYYFGGPVKLVRARETVECHQADYRPPGLDPQWSVAPGREQWWGRAGSIPSFVALGPSAEHGHVESSFGSRSVDEHRPAHCTYAIALADATQREVGAEASAWVHPRFYLAAQLPWSVEANAALDIPLATLDFDGSPLPVDAVSVAITRRWSEPEWVKEDGEKVFAGWRERSEVLAPCKTDTRSGPATCSFAKLQPGSYEVRVRADDKGYAPTIEGWFWVPEPDQPNYFTWSSTPVATLAIELDKPKPKPGERVRARVRAPWASGKGVVMLAKGGLHELRRFTLEQGSAELEFTATDAWIPGVELHAMMIQPGTALTHPRVVTSSARVELSNVTRRLDVHVEVPTEARAGETLPIVVQARDMQDQPVRGHVSVWAVDEAVLALAPLTLPSFVDAFTVELGAGLAFANGYGALMFPYVAQADLYAPIHFVPGWAEDELLGGLGLMGYGSGFGSGGASFSGRGAASPSVRGVPMPARSKFSSAPIFIGDAELGPEGIAKLSGELPDNLTTFRVTAVVSAPLPAQDVEARFGSSDTRVRVTKPVIVRSALPRILRPGDRAEVGVLVDNLRAGAGEVEVEVALLDAEGKLELLGKPKARLAIGAGEQVRVPFEVRALTTGTPRFEARATVHPREGKREGDALVLPLPIEPERTLSDRVAVYGTMDERVALLPFELPTDVDPAFGGLSVSIGSTLLGGLEDAVAYLVTYPHGCLEQTSSSLLPLVPLGRLAATYPLGITDVDEYVAVGIRRLESMQLPNGGFAYWPGGREASRYGSAYATWVLVQAARSGYDVPDAMLERALAYLAGEVTQWQAHTAPARSHDIEIALALAALASMQAAPPEALDKLFERRMPMPLFTKAMLALALVHQTPDDPRADQLLGELRSFVDEREASARIEGDGELWTWYWDSHIRSSALVLMAMLTIDPEHALVPKLARGLLDARKAGRWSNTQENAYALLALADYAAVYEADEPHFQARVWLDRQALARVDVEGRSFDVQEGFTPMAELLGAKRHAAPASELLLERAGVGRMYYRVGLEWTSTAADLPARSEGLAITHALRNVQGTIADDQVIATGDLLALDVTLETRSELTHVAVDLPLPAGLEAIDLELGKGSAAMKISGNRAHWVNHQELRRDRAVVFADRLAPGTHVTTIFVRATTPGEYLMPPGTAEMMYYPEVYGRTSSRRVSVR